MTYELSVKADIASAHFIPGYDGPCANLHGHTWMVEVFIRTEQLDRLGMVTDFKVIKDKLKSFLQPLDHVCLNDLDYFKQHLPTTENIARYIYDHFSSMITPLALSHVCVWESASASVTYWSPAA